VLLEITSSGTGIFLLPVGEHGLHHFHPHFWLSDATGNRDGSLRATFHPSMGKVLPGDVTALKIRVTVQPIGKLIWGGAGPGRENLILHGGALLRLSEGIGMDQGLGGVIRSPGA
jgi:hypothetical protein